MSTFFILPDAQAGDAVDELFIGADGRGAIRVSADQFVQMERQIAALRAAADEAIDYIIGEYARQLWNEHPSYDTSKAREAANARPPYIVERLRALKEAR